MQTLLLPVIALTLHFPVIALTLHFPVITWPPHCYVSKALPYPADVYEPDILT